MSELVEKIKTDFIENYFIEVNINNQIIYNLIKRPLGTRKILREKIKISKL